MAQRAPGAPSIELGRSSFALVGLLWAMRSLQSFLEPNFTDPESASDWWAVVTISLALALLPAALALLVVLSQGVGRISLVLLAVAALGAVAAAIANVIEDGLGVAGAGNVYYASIVLMMLTLLALAGVLAAGHPRWPGLVVLGSVIGMVLLEKGGGLMILLAWGAAAITLRPRTGTGL